MQNTKETKNVGSKQKRGTGFKERLYRWLTGRKCTCNPNMPVRFLIYLAEEYQQVIEQAERSLNNNYGHNEKLMESCQTLAQYAQFVAVSRQ